MMLTYYQAVELMSCLPILLSPAEGNKIADEADWNGNNIQSLTDYSSETLELLSMLPLATEVNAEYFAA